MSSALFCEGVSHSKLILWGGRDSLQRKSNRNSNNIAVQARNLIKRYGELTAVNGIDFDILEGECFGFLGPNGAGKTSR